MAFTRVLAQNQESFCLKHQNAGQTESNDPQCPFPQGLGSLRENLVQPTRQEGASPKGSFDQGRQSCSEARQIT